MPHSYHLPVPSPAAVDFLRTLTAGDRETPLTRRTPKPIHKAVSYACPDGSTGLGDLYTPGAGTRIRAAMLLVPGVARGGKDDPRLIGFAESACRLGFLVLVPELATLRQLNVRPEHTAIVTAAFTYLLGLPETPAGRTGIGGLSFAMGPGLIAALQPAIREQVQFVFCIGGYFDLQAEMRFVTTGLFQVRGGKHRPGPEQRITPDPYGRWVLLASFIDRVPDASEREVLREIVDRRVLDATAPIDEPCSSIKSPEGQALLAFVTNTEPERFAPLWAELPTVMRDDMASMDVSAQDLSGLHAKLILVHGFADELIPYTESLALHRAVPRGQSRLYVVRGLGHVTMGKLRPIDYWRLMSAVTALLRERG